MADKEEDNVSAKNGVDVLSDAVKRAGADSPSESMSATAVSADVAVREARRVTWIGFGVNAVLGIVKVVVGIFGRSGALVADGVHSFSDFITDAIVLLMVGASRKRPDTRYRYGHGKYETFATMLIAVLLVVVGAGILVDGISHIVKAISGVETPRPGFATLVICLLSIASKEWLFRYTLAVGRHIRSGAVIANAWHHRSDAFSSLATLAGIAGAMFLGPSWRVLDPIAAAVVAVFIILVGIKMAIPSVRELLDASLPANMEDEIRAIIASTPGVIAYHHLRTRPSGPNVIMEVHLKVDPNLTVCQGHSIATAVEDGLREAFGDDSIVTTHLEPYRGCAIHPDGSCDD